MIKTTPFLAVGCLTAFGLAACGTQREDVIECGLSDGSTFVLSAAYEWQPLANVLPHVAPRLNQESFEALYKDKDGNAKVVSAVAASYRDLKSDPSGQAMCANFGKKNQVPYLGGYPSYYLPMGAGEFRSLPYDDQPSLAGPIENAKNENEKNLRGRALAENLRSGIFAVTALNSRVVWEVALTKDNDACRDALNWRAACPIVSVLKQVSLDSGQTWQAAHITHRSEIFEIGRTVYQQSFIARPTKINGKKISQGFPFAPQ